MAKKRRKYSAEFKAEAVKLVVEQGLSATQAARDLGIPQSVLSRWVARERRDAEPGAITAAERDELRRLRRENDILRQERDILKNAAAFFAKEM